MYGVADFRPLQFHAAIARGPEALSLSPVELLVSCLAKTGFGARDG